VPNFAISETLPTKRKKLSGTGYDETAGSWSYAMLGGAGQFGWFSATAVPEQEDSTGYRQQLRQLPFR